MGVTALTLAGQRAIRVRAHLPAWGAWHADVELDADATLAGRVDLVVNDLTLKGTVLAGGPTGHGRSDYRIVGGAGGLGRALLRTSYANDAGVKVVTVVGDALREAGEEFDATTAAAAPALAGARLGPAWTRPADLACRVLEQVAPGAWYVGEDGVVRLGARASRAYTGSAARVTPIDRARQRLTLAPESIVDLVPGAVVDGLEAIDVVHSADADGLRTTVYGAGVATGSKFLDSFRRLLEQLDPDRKFRAPYEYRVVQQIGERVDLQPVLVSTGMPDLRRVPMRPGLAGAKSTLTPGARVLVAWVNGDPARPFVSSFEEADGQGFLPVSTTIRATATVALDAVAVDLGDAAQPVGRSGDATIGPTLVTTQTKVRA